MKSEFLNKSSIQRLKATLVIVGILLGVVTTQAQKIDTKSFETTIEGNQLFLSYKSDRVELAKGQNWLFSYDEIFIEFEYPDTLLMPSISELPTPNGVKAVKLSRHQYLLLLSFYSAPADGRTTAGVDILLAFNTATKVLSNVVTEVGMPPVGRGWGPCRNATMNTYLLQDVNDDGALDIGLLREKIMCDFENDSPSKPYYAQEPIQWFLDMSLSSFKVWIPDLDYQGLVPEKYIELSSLPLSPVDVVGSNLWKTSNRMEWPSKTEERELVITKSMRKRMKEEAKGKR